VSRTQPSGELSPQHLLLPVSIIKLAKRLGAKRLASNLKENCLQNIAFNHLINPRVGFLQNPLSQLCLHQLFGLASFGAKVVFPRASRCFPEPGSRNNVRIAIITDAEMLPLPLNKPGDHLLSENQMEEI